MKSENEIEVNDELIVRYLSGEASPDEAMALNDWLNKESENKFHFEALEATWNASRPMKKLRPINKENAWRKLGVKEIVKTRIIGIDKLSFRIAASIVFIIISGLIIYVKINSPSRITIATLDSSRNIVFPDSSNVTLYHNTSITFPDQFENDSREVNLISGEAFFNIMADKQKPFIIRTAFADIKVIGTEFNIVAKEDHVEVEVKEGLVLLSTAVDSVYLKEGSSGIVRFDDGSIVSNNAVDINSWAYATKKFVFKDTPIRDIIWDMEKAFGCSISVSNESIKECKLTATFDNDSAEKIVSLIAESLNLSLRKNGRVFTLEGEGCP